MGVRKKERRETRCQRRRGASEEAWESSRVRVKRRCRKKKTYGHFSDYGSIYHVDMVMILIRYV